MGSPASEPLSLDRYELLRPLGKGAMGAVYEGQHRITGRHVAIKVLHPEFATNRVMVERFFNEARAAATLGHPNIVECLDAGVATSGQAYLVLEYIQGRSLAAELERLHTLPPVRAVRIALQVASALSAAHVRGVIHRDLKPDNIFLSKLRGQEDHVTVLDFGISRFHSHGAELLTRAGAVLGTPAYMAPEQLADSSTVEGTADIYALGATLYQVLTGTIPFSADSLIALADKIATEPPRPLERVRPGIAPGLSRVVLRSMAKAPGDRYPTMQAFAAALAAATGVDPLPEEHTDRTAPHRSDGGHTGESRTEEVELPDDADVALRPGGIRATANPLSTRAAWAGPKRRHRTAIGGAVAAAGVVLVLIVAGVASHHESRVLEPVQVVGDSARPEPLVPTAPKPAPDAPPVALGERVLMVPAARPGSIPELALVTTRFPALPVDLKVKKADRAVHAKIAAELAKPAPSIRELDRAHKAFGEMMSRYGAGAAWQVVRAWLALTLADAHRVPGHPPNDFTGPGCPDDLVAEGLAAEERAKHYLDASVIQADVLEAANRGYVAYFAGVAHECQGLLARASKEYQDALKVGDQLNAGFRRSVLLHEARASLALGDPHRAQEMLDQCYEPTPTPERQTLQVWTAALTWNCPAVVRVGRAMRQQAVKEHAAAPLWLDRLEAACLIDPASEQAGQAPTTGDAYFGEPSGQARLEEARQAFGDVSTPAAALRSALRLCYFRDRLAASPDSLAVTVGGRFEQPVLSGAPAERLTLLQPCLAAELLADKLQGPIADSTVDLRVTSP